MGVWSQFPGLIASAGAAYRQTQQSELEKARQEREARMREATEARLLAAQEAANANTLEDNRLNRERFGLEQAEKSKKDLLAPFEIKNNAISGQLNDIYAPGREAALKIPSAQPDETLADGQAGPPASGSLQALKDIVSRSLGEGAQAERNFNAEQNKFKQGRLELAEREFGRKSENDHRLTEKQTETQKGYDRSLLGIQRIRAQANKIAPGRWRYWAEKALAEGGLNDPDFAVLKAEVGTDVANTVRQFSGTAASDRERGFLEGLRANVKDDPKVFHELLDASERRTLEDKEEDMRGNYRYRGNAPSNPGTPSLYQGSTAAPPVRPGFVRVQTPDGRTGQIPQAKLQDYLQKHPGAKQVQ